MTRFAWRSPRRVGCALGADALYVAIVGRRGTEPDTFTCQWSEEQAERPWPERFAAAMQEIVSRCGTSRVALRVAILPPLARHRFIALPALSLDDARRVLQRDATRYWCGVGAEQAVAVTRPVRPRGPLAAVAVDAALLDALERVVADSGAQLDGVCSAADVWAAHVPTVADGQIAVLGDVRYDRLEVFRGRLIGLRSGPARFLDGGADAVHRDDGSWRLRTAVLALRANHGDPLISDRLREAAARRAWRHSMYLGGAAAVLLAVAGGLDLWGLQREHAHVRAVRQTAQSATAHALSLRELVALRVGHLAALSAARQQAPRWTAMLAQLAEALPGDAYLTGLQATVDSVIIEGVAGSAAGVFNALHEMGGVSQVQALAPIRHERTEGQAAIERFVIGLSWSDSTLAARP